MKTNKTRNWGEWTEARFKSFIISALRGASRRWWPKNKCIQNARVGRGLYKCSLCWKIVPLSKKEGKRKRIQIVADHRCPIVNPTVWFVDYNTWIERCFIEEDGFQALCLDCHTKKTNEEKIIAKNRKNGN